ncbi:MAG: protein kinase [Gemmataceae bacterium]
MENLDAATIGQHAVRLGLLTLDQLQEGYQETGSREGDAQPLVRALERKGYLTPWQSHKLMKLESDGYFYGGYRILYKISSGTFGRVYRADDPLTGNVVAVKVLRSRWTENRKNIDLFEREGQVGMAMKHPNIVEIINVRCDHEGKQFYIVMEFVEGGNLRDILKIRNKLEPLETIKILEGVTTGLVYAFSRGVTHRDMKLTNVLVSSEGVPKLVDFGLATLNQNLHRDADAKVDRTVDYAGLEKATGVPLGDTRSDIYFLGTVAYELLTGRSPLEKSRNPNERMRSSRFLNADTLTEEDVTAPPSVFRLIDTMMALDPHKRYQTPSQLLDAIRDVRRELEGHSSNSKNNPSNSVFIVEGKPKLQDALRQGFKKLGYRVFISGDPVRALDRFRQQPFDSLIMDAGTAGEDGIYVFDRIMDEASRARRPCAGILMLSEDQQEFTEKVRARPNVAILTRPIKFGQLRDAVKELLAKTDWQEE